MLPEISIVIPLYNESKVFEQLIQRLNGVINSISSTTEVILVDDGSKDDTAFKMRQISTSDSRYKSLILSRNFGHQIALSAGLKFANGTKAIFIIDGDLQDPPELLAEFYTYIEKGYDVVYAVRKNRKENFIKVYCYNAFYKILRKISYIDIPLDSGDFSLISRRVVDALNTMPENNRYIRGMRSWIGYEQIGIEYNRDDRKEGESKYSFSKLLKLAMDGIFNFSEIPIKFISLTGLITILGSVLFSAYTLFKYFVFDNVPEGFTSITIILTLFGGIQLLSLGVIGEYVLRIFFQVKDRPLFLIKEFIDNSDTKKPSKSQSIYNRH